VEFHNDEGISGFCDKDLTGLIGDKVVESHLDQRIVQ
jgi:hypothetical protein